MYFFKKIYFYFNYLLSYEKKCEKIIQKCKWHEN